MSAPFDLAALRCTCGSGAIVCVDPGSAAEMDGVIGVMLVRGVAARGWCAQCYARLPALACETPKRRRVRT
jgi:hypothetical protein